MTGHTHDEACPICYGVREVLGLGPRPFILCYGRDTDAHPIPCDRQEKAQ